VFDELIAQAALHPANRIDLYAQAEAVLIDEDLAFAPLFHEVRNWLVRPWVDGLITTVADGEVPGDWFLNRARILPH
jgi:ABC-type oligopeptide transport system substrate-binding subunit